MRIPALAATVWAFWAVPASAASDYLVKDISPFSSNADSNPHGFVELSGVSVFDAFDEEFGNEPWRSDGTAAGTYRLVDACPGPCGQDTRVVCSDKGWLLFSADDEHSEAHNWLTDGTRSGTRPFTLGEPSRILQCGTLPGGDLLLESIDGAHGQELWRSNGTVEGTVLVRDFTPGPNGSLFSSFTRLGTRTLFSVYDPAKGWVLWTTDGTSGGTKVLKDF